MRQRNLVVSLVSIVLIAATALAATFIAGRSPLLGLDLEGGVSVVLQPHGQVTPAVLEQAVSIIDRRVNHLGVANSTVERQGDDVVIELPGVKNSQAALRTIGTTAELFFRPVLCNARAYVAPGKVSATPTSVTTDPAAKTGEPSASLADYCGPGASALPKGAPTSTAALPSTNPDNDNPDDNVVVPSAPGAGSDTVRWILGPADLKGEIVKTASSALNPTDGEYVVNVTLTGKGLSEFNTIARVRHASYDASATSHEPFTSLEAIELDGVLESAPTIAVASFTGPIQISGSFTAGQASTLATQLRYGSLPVRFDTGSISTVSATLGHSSLIAGLFAGLGGLVLVLLYMILYYRALGLVVVLGLGVGGAILYSILTELSFTSSLALTLSGIVGVIVSIGITVDSYVVYFERLKDEVRQGRTVRASVERGFTRAFKTVLTADLVSFMAALILYLFTVGDVKGFAFTLGLSTLLDVATAYLFIRPIVILLGRRRTTSETGFLGISRGLGAARPQGAP